MKRKYSSPRRRHDDIGRGMAHLRIRIYVEKFFYVKNLLHEAAATVGTLSPTSILTLIMHDLKESLTFPPPPVLDIYYTALDMAQLEHNMRHVFMDAYRVQRLKASPHQRVSFKVNMIAWPEKEEFIVRIETHGSVVVEWIHTNSSRNDALKRRLLCVLDPMHALFLLYQEWIIY